MIGSNVHFIFALDESYSMEGNPWSDLMKAFQETLSKIIKFSGKASNNKISIINFT